MSTANNKPKLIIGIGHPDRGDDGIGFEIIRQLKNKNFTHVEFKVYAGDGFSLMDLWKDRDEVIMVDAVSSKAPPGHIHRIDARAEPVPVGIFNCSTHNFGVAEAVELGKTLNQLPKKLFIMGIEGKKFDSGNKLSPEVANVLPQILSELEELIHA